MSFLERISFQDETGKTIASSTEPVGLLSIEEVHLWQPLHAYLYTCVVELWQQGQLLDTYEQPFGVRTIKIKDGKFLINGQPFYFKGFGRHEDSPIYGRGLDEVLNVKDFNLFKWIGANSLALLRAELTRWNQVQPDKPMMFTDDGGFSSFSGV